MTSILFQNSDKTIFLVDIPSSISLAQGHTNFTTRNLISSSALESPFPVANEPSDPAKVRDNTSEESYHSEIKGFIRKAIAEVRLEHRGDWCLPRHQATSVQPARKKRRKNNGTSDQDCKYADEKGSCCSTMISRSGLPINQQRSYGHGLTSACNSSSAPFTITDTNLEIYNYAELDNRVFQNSLDEVTRLTVTTIKTSDDRHFHIPGQSTFLLSKIEDSISTFKSSATTLLNSSAPNTNPGQFDFILLDPPWPNASAKRSRSYQTLRSMYDTEQLLASMRLEDHIGRSGFVAIWITNKQKLRDLLLRKKGLPSDDSATSRDEEKPYGSEGRAGLFEKWGVQLKEEWIWVKTTTSGEPVTALESAWRKPYEVMLLGQRKPTSGYVTPDEPEEIVRRVIFAVPAIHSMKPSVKELVENIVLERKQSRVLEVFARYLTEGWWAWGDEVLKFNSHSWWKRDEDEVNTT